jgi:hypothetical protein
MQHQLSNGMHAMPQVFSRRISAAAILAVFLVSHAAGADDVSIVRVEEDWELVVVSPDTNSSGPQVSCVFSPVSHVTSLHATFEINHQSLPHFVAGGVQLQIWHGETACGTHKFPNASVMNTPNEKVEWTQSMEIDDGRLLFEVTDGSSATWGEFGGQGYLKTSFSTSLENLNDYSPSVSVSHSGVTYAAHRVGNLVLKRIRFISSDGTTVETDTPKTVFAND